MNWIKKTHIYCPCGENGFDVSHCHKPTPLIINDDTIRVYFGVRDNVGKTRTTFVDLDVDKLLSDKKEDNTTCVKYVHNKPILDLGKIGAFDDSGANVSSVVRVNDDTIYMYYIGWNPSTTVHTRNSIGLSISYDNGFSFKRMYDGSVLDRTKDEPYYTGAVDVLCEKGIWKIWYTSGTEWKIVNNKPEIYYHIKYATSTNGVDWLRENISCIKPINDLEATARPCVIFDADSGKYLMWYSRRDLVNFRVEAKHGYRGGYAESFDGTDWIRMDTKFGVDVSPDGWDSEAIAYPYVTQIRNRKIMFYNGNGFGRTGFGYAVGM